MRAAFVVVPALFLALIAYGLVKTTEPKAVVGAPAPAFSLASLDGRSTLTDGDLRGSPVVVNFWASWCVSCPAEAADLERMWKEYGPKGVKFLGVTNRDGLDAARAFVAQYGVTYPNVHDPDERLASQFGVRGVPETYFIGPDYTFAGFEAAEQITTQNGTAVYGPISAPVLRAHIEAMLAASPPAS